EAITMRDVIRKLMENQKALELGTAQLYLMNFAACQGSSLPGTLTEAVESAESPWKRAARLRRLRRLRRYETLRALEARAERAATHASGSWSGCHSRTKTTEPRPALRKLDPLVDDSAVETVHRNGHPQVDTFFVLAGVVARRRLRRRGFVDQALSQVTGPETPWLLCRSEHHSDRRLLDPARPATLDLQQVIDHGTGLEGHVPGVQDLG